jgi:hypothetical protein
MRGRRPAYSGQSLCARTAWCGRGAHGAYGNVLARRGGVHLPGSARMGADGPAIPDNRSVRSGLRLFQGGNIVPVNSYRRGK